ncbi:MAG: FAD-dependent oxidoreductase [Chloroflexi bacterium]|nr:FAD-dependent oxidoreductase [Chloroflexota bacterium]
MNQQKDILVIGGGVIGVATAYYLAEQGRSVTLIEKDEICAGSSHGNAGLIAKGVAIPMAAPGVLWQGMKWLLDAESPFSIKPRLDFDLVRWLWQFRGACNEKKMRQSIAILLSLGQGSFDLFDELLAKEALEFGYERKGRLLLFRSEAAFEKAIPDTVLLREFGVDSTLLDAAGVREMEPTIQTAVTHGIYVADYGHLMPDRFVHELARVAKDRGVTFKTNTAVLGFETSGHQISSVVTSQGSFTPDHVVLATGAWSPIIARHLKLKLPIQPAKGYSVTYERPLRHSSVQASSSPQYPLSLHEPHIAVTPMGDKLRFTSTLELAGYNPSINQRRVAAIRRTAHEYLSGMEDLQETAVWSGFRPLTPDDLPIIGRTGTFTNLILATGHGTLGMTHGLITGKLVSQIIGGERPSIDLAPLSIERFR